MTTTELLALTPFITLTTVILAVMLVIAFVRNLALTVLISCLGLVITLASIFWVGTHFAAMMVTPLLVVDPYALLFSTIIIAAAFLVCLLAYSYHADRGDNQDEFILLLLLSTLGGMTLAHSAHFASLILGMEVVGVSLYAMISYPHRGLLSVEAALKYLILSGVSSAVVLFGIALVFATTGTLAFNELNNATATQATADPLFVLGGTTLVMAGIAFKLSLVPFHMWTPDVYEGAPAPATAFLATVSKGGIFAVLMRFFISFDGYRFETILDGIFWLALLSIIFGNLLAVMQNSIKRLLAYSSIAHLGYLMVAFIAASVVSGKQLAIEASVFFLIAYFVTTIGAFGVVSIMSTQPAEHDIDQLAAYEGLFWRRPLLAVFFSAMLLSLAGIPLTMGFVGKFYILAAGVESGLWELLAAVVIGSGISLFYYLRIIFTMTRQSEVAEEVHIPAAGGWALGAVSLMLVALGVYPTPVVEWVSYVASSLT
jgi:NADH-quinone oxidoreductase subunit N